jgi:hypothetical protein
LIYFPSLSSALFRSALLCSHSHAHTHPYLILSYLNIYQNSPNKCRCNVRHSPFDMISVDFDQHVSFHHFEEPSLSSKSLRERNIEDWRNSRNWRKKRKDIWYLIFDIWYLIFDILMKTIRRKLIDWMSLVGKRWDKQSESKAGTDKWGNWKVKQKTFHYNCKRERERKRKRKRKKAKKKMEMWM